MFQSHMRFCRMQWLPARFYGSLSVYSRPPFRKHNPFAAQLKIAFRLFLLVINDHSLGTEIQLTIFSIQLDCVLIIKLILVKSTVNPTREILKLEI